ncbi:3-phosphoinositide-dependent protein kinase 1 isoform X1 [Culex quinquefasciatus]|uniref:3-phosphoinositide-dependent protein kinase 1 isoform X1 n=1 Tax=Culex quinquefasciatus TaxID=7176 RepID=UPI0018E30AA5|nr:3-phosphoinositide-dependent protein kinase 1 isoform X1 [Culex quinquefasciatus]XP_038116209.1 3-phosphoinositide-dependent protein kinase 1 isoform X1 [Culex quinquefasciatus]
MSSEPVTNNRAKRSDRDFIFGKVIGEGSFSVVYLAKDIHTSKECAIKVCEKQQIVREKKQDYVKREREALNRLSGISGFLNLYCTFQDPRNLYFVMTYARKGTLLKLLEKSRTFDVDCARFYSAEILLAIEHMHTNNIIHRDLKPENILLDENHHILIADFGSSRLDDVEPKCESSDEYSDKDDTESDSDELKAHMKHSKRKRGSFVGTAQYVSPEILKGRRSSKCSDLWSYGCIIYQMLTGFPPFRGPNDYLIFQKITKLELSFTSDFDYQAKDLVSKLLLLDPRKRIGADDNSPYASIRNHDFHRGIEFSAMRTGDPPVPNENMKGTSIDEISPTDEPFKFPDNVKPGLNVESFAAMMGLSSDVKTENVVSTSEIVDYSNMSKEEKLSRIEKQNPTFGIHLLTTNSLSSEDL